jgi:hypothetical protein
METKTPTEYEKRVTEFRDKYLALVKEYDVDFISYPQFVQKSNGAFEIICTTNLVDKKTVATPSPIQQKDGKIIQ